ncbi:type VII secretion-associated serine protease mycosin [Mycobacterium avium]|uniref:type VII secretion-associated serine protease mycosin n=1 Tax=Mycobacterium avium TaxID=1764 RepID=UPI000A057F2E|nr:type VII secretion-associated serine protease mycosin [Mycobacterium avium]
MSRRKGLHCAAALAAVSALVGAIVGPPGAWAITPPPINPAAVPPDTVGPEQPMRPSTICQTPGVLEASNFTDPPPAWRLLDLEAARPLATGAGVTVALIDTGVTPNPRLANLRPGGDYIVESDQGLHDCDGHGTLVAGIIAAAPSRTDGFVGVAPDAALISIRQSSEYFDLQNPAPANADPNASRTAIDLRAMARAVVHAANLGAQVVNISMVSCMKAVHPVDDATLGAAIHWAVAERNVVVVAAAGNTGNECNPQNPPPAANDPGSWSNVVTVASPAWWADDVLSVASVTNDGVPSTFSLHGPWVGVAAPGETITSVGNYPDGHLVNGLPGKDGPLVPIYGTSFAAAYVSGVAALVRQKYPELNAYQVINRIKSTAHAGPAPTDPAVGWGVVDPLAALTWNVADPAPKLPVNKVIVPAPAPPAPDVAPRRVASWVLGGVAAAAVIIVAAVAALRRKPHS